MKTQHFSHFLLSDVLSGCGEITLLLSKVFKRFLPTCQDCTEKVLFEKKMCPKTCFAFFQRNIKLIGNCSNSTSEIGGSCLGILRKRFCFLSFFFVLGLLPLKDNFIDFECTSQSGSRDKAQLQAADSGRQLTVPRTSCLSGVTLKFRSFKVSVDSFGISEFWPRQ